MSENAAINRINRRQFLTRLAAAEGAFVLGFWVPSQTQAQSAQTAATPPEINAWIVISPDDTVTIRIAQSELGQGIWTSNAMMVCEELQCDWKQSTGRNTRP
jgi:isoquinoline 1-oxidoreductase beta subunit